MNLYDMIKSPLTDENILEIIDIYANGKSDSSNKEINDGDDLYSCVIKNKNEKNDESKRNEYIKKFRNLYLKYCGGIFDELKNIDALKYDEIYRNAINKYENNGQEDLADDIRFNSFYPLNEKKYIFDKFDSFEELYNFYLENQDAIRLVASRNLYSSNKTYYDEKLKEYGYTEDDIKLLNDVYHILKRIEKKFSGGGDVMGFHINCEKASIYNKGKREKDDIKFYINAGSDTYRVAERFEELCDFFNLNYYYKVVNPNRDDEYFRNDKMCIYSSYENAPKFIRILYEIKYADLGRIHFYPVSPYAGTIDDFIGVGQDHIKEGMSYNRTMSNIYFNILEDVFKNIDSNNISEYVKNNPRIIDVIKERVLVEAKKIGLSEEKLCIKKENEKNLNLEVNTATYSHFSGGVKKFAKNPYNNLSKKCVDETLSSLETVNDEKKQDQSDELKQKYQMINSLKNAIEKQKSLKNELDLRIKKEKEQLEEQARQDNIKASKMIQNYLKNEYEKLTSEYQNGEEEMQKKEEQHRINMKNKDLELEHEIEEMYKQYGLDKEDFNKKL